MGRRPVSGGGEPATIPVPKPVPAAVPERVAAAFAALDGTGIAWALLRGPGGPIPGRDVDLLVAYDELGAAVTSLRDTGFVPLPSDGRRGQALVAWSGGAESAAFVDVATELAFGPAPRLATHAEDAVLAAARRIAGVERLAEADEAWAFLLHVALDRPRLDDGRRDTLSTMRAELLGGGALAGAVQRAGGREAFDRLTDAVAHEAWDAAVDGLAGIHRRSAARLGRLRRARASSGRLVQLLPGLVRRPGLLVVIAAGDPAVGAAVAARLDRWLPVRVRVRGPRKPRDPRSALLPAAMALDLARGRVVVELADRGGQTPPLPADLVVALGAAAAGRVRCRRVEVVEATGGPDMLAPLVAERIWRHAARRLARR